MKVFLIDIRKYNSNQEYDLCLDVLKDYFNKYHIDYFILKENEFNVDPSWLKLKCFDYIEDDFVLCWDVDLLPKKDTSSIVNDLNLGKVNLSIDSTVILKNQPLWMPEFKYNCGLIGIPKSYKKSFENIFDAKRKSDWPSYEQYHVNKFLYPFDDVHELDKTWNCQWHMPTLGSQYILSAKAVHYTGPMVFGPHRNQLIKNHHELYFKKYCYCCLICAASLFLFII